LRKEIVEGVIGRGEIYYYIWKIGEDIVEGTNKGSFSFSDGTIRIDAKKYE